MSAIDPVSEHDCFANPDDLKETEDDRPGVTVRVCSVCGRRHFEVDAEPLAMGVKPD